MTMIVRMMRAVACCGLAIGISLGAAADAIPMGGLPGISGLAKLGDNAWLAVHDTKVTKAPESEGARISLLTLNDLGEAACTPLEVDWNTLKGGRTNDLESICELTGHPGEFVMVESSYKANDFARIIHLKASLEDGKATVTLLGAVRFLPRLDDGTEFDNIEGAQTFQRGDTTYLLLAKRGKNEKKARLIWGELNWDKPVFKVTEDYKVWTPFKDFDVPKDKRYASDLLILNKELYIVSCNDPGDDGPFTSVVYHVGAIRDDGQLIHLIDSDQSEVVRYEGHKIEALAPYDEEKGLWIAGSDDENFKGVVFVTSRP